MRDFYIKHKKLYIIIAIFSLVVGFLLPFIPIFLDNPNILGIFLIIGIVLCLVGILFLIQLADYTKSTNYWDCDYREYNTISTSKIFTSAEENNLKRQSFMLEKIKVLLDAYNKVKSNEEIYDYLTGYIAENPNILYFRFLEFLVPIQRHYYDLEIISEHDFKYELNKEYEDLTAYNYIIGILKNDNALDFIRELSYYKTNKELLIKSNHYNENAINYAHPIFINFNDIFLDALISNQIIEDNFESKFSLLCLLLELIKQTNNDVFIEEIISKYKLKENESIEYYTKEALNHKMQIDEYSFVFEYTAYNNTQNMSVKTYDKAISENIESVKSIKESFKKQSYLTKLKNATKNYNENKTTISDIDLMSGKQFEYYICDLLQKLGFDAKVTRLSGDQGADIIAEKDNTKYVVQTKCYKKPVSNKAIQEVVSSMKIYKAEKSIVITNSTFTKSAIELAKANNVLLWDREILKEKMEEVE